MHVLALVFTYKTSLRIGRLYYVVQVDNPDLIVEDGMGLADRDYMRSRQERADGRKRNELHGTVSWWKRFKFRVWCWLRDVRV